MVRLSELLDTGCIILSLEAKKKKDAMEEMVNSMFKAGRIKEPGKILERLIQREKMGTTGIGGGIAIPHLMTDLIQETLMVFARKKEGVKFDAIDRQAVHLLFLLVGPRQDPQSHLALLCKLSRFLHDSQFKNGLLQAKDEKEIIHILKDKEEKRS